MNSEYISNVISVIKPKEAPAVVVKGAINKGIISLPASVKQSTKTLPEAVVAVICDGALLVVDSEALRKAKPVEGAVTVPLTATFPASVPMLELLGQRKAI